MWHLKLPQWKCRWAGNLGDIVKRPRSTVYDDRMSCVVFQFDARVHRVPTRIAEALVDGVTQGHDVAHGAAVFLAQRVPQVPFELKLVIGKLMATALGHLCPADTLFSRS